MAAEKKIATVVAKVRLDTSDAGKELNAAMRKANSTLPPVEVKADTTKATRKTKKDIEGVKPEVEVKADTTRAKRQTKAELESVKAKLKVEVDTAHAEALVEERFRTIKPGVTPELNTALFRAKMIALGKSEKIKVDVGPNIDTRAFIERGVLGTFATAGGEAAAGFLGAFGNALKATAGWRKTIEAASPELLGAIAPVAVVAAGFLTTVVVQAIGAAFLTGAAGSAIALGVYGAVQNPKVKEAAKSIGTIFKQEAVVAGGAFTGPLTRGLNAVAKLVREIDLASLVRPLAGSVEPLMTGLIEMVRQALPGIREAVAASAPFINAIAAKLPDMGKAIGYFATAMAKTSGSATGFFRAVMSLADGLLYAIGGFAKFADYIVGLMEKLRAEVELIAGVVAGPIGTLLTKAFFDGKKSGDDLAKSMKNVGTETEILSGSWSESTKKASAATSQTKQWAAALESASGIKLDLSGVQSMADINKAINNTLTDMSTKIRDVIQARMELRNDVMAGAQSEIQWNQWLADRNKQLSETTLTLDLNTQAGRDNKTMLLEGVGALNSHLQAQAQSIAETQGATAAEEWLTKARASGNAELVQTAMKLGLTKDQADALVASMLQTDQDIQASVKLNGYAEMQSQLDELNRQMAYLKDTLLIIQNQNGPLAGLSNYRASTRRFGGVTYARNGLMNLKDPGIFPATQGNLYGFAEPGTGGEAFIAKNAPRDASLEYLDTAAKWHNARVVTEEDLKKLSTLFDGGPQNGAAKSWDDSWKGASTTVSTTWENMSAVTSNMFDTILGEVTQGTADITTAFTGMGTAVTAANQGMLSKLAGGFTSSFAYIDTLIAKWSNTTVGAFSALSARLGEVFRGIPRQAWESLSGVVTVVNDLIVKLNSIDGVHIAPMGPVAQPAAFAKGGKVFGPGTGTSDDVDAKLSKGEFVVKAKAVNALESAYGRGIMNHLNNYDVVGGDRGSGGATLKPKFAEGGHVQAALDLLKQYNGRPYVFGGTPPNTDCSGWVGMGWAAAQGKDPFRRYFDTTSVLSTGRWAPGAIKNGFNINLNPNPGSSGHISGELAGHRFESGGSHGYSAFDGPSAAIGSFGSQYHSLDIAASKTDQVRDILGNVPFMDGLRKALPGGAGLFSGVPQALFNKVVDGLSVKDWDLFDSGGILDDKAVGVNRSGGPEAVLTNDEYQMLKTIAAKGGINIKIEIHGNPTQETTADMVRQLTWALG